MRVKFTQQRSHKDTTYITRKCEVAEHASLSLFGTIFGEHGTNRDHGTGEDASQTTKEDHLPYGLTETKEGSTNSNSVKRQRQNWLSSETIGSL